jgi:beta-galactosidase
MQARVGVSRALMNANVPFEHVTATDLRRGLAPRYAVIYLPSVVSLHRDLLPRLEEYVRQGGRLVLDLPGACFDERGALLPTGKDTILERIFGATIDDFQGAGVNVSYRVEGLELEGFVFQATPTRADVLATYDNGNAAVTQAALGKGTAVLLGWEASRMCFRPGRGRAESLLVRYTLGKLRSPYRCEGALVYRLAAPTADHYFLVHDGEAKEVTLETGARRYEGVIDAISGEPVPVGDDGAIPVRIKAHGGRWLRAVRMEGGALRRFRGDRASYANQVPEDRQ